VLYHGNRRAAKEDHPEDSPIPEELEAGTFAPDDIRPEDLARGDSSDEKEQPNTLADPARLRELIEGVAYNSDIPTERTRGAEAAVAELVLDG